MVMALNRLHTVSRLAIALAVLGCAAGQPYVGTDDEGNLHVNSSE